MGYVLIGGEGNEHVVNFAASLMMTHLCVFMEDFVIENKPAGFHTLMNTKKHIF